MVTKTSQTPVSPVQELLFIESFKSAVHAVAARVGGMKALGLMIWPAKGDSAEGWLSDCLNPDRPAKMAPEEVFQVARIGRENGVHTVMYYIADFAHYARPNPIEPEDERAQLQREFNEGAKRLERVLARMEQLKPGRAV